MFRLDSLSGPTEEECKHKEQLGNMNERGSFFKRGSKWTESVRQAPEFRELFQENRWLRMLSLSLLSVHTGLLLFILYADVVHQAGFMAACVIFGLHCRQALFLRSQSCIRFCFGRIVLASVLPTAFIPFVLRHMRRAVYFINCLHSGRERKQVCLHLPKIDSFLEEPSEKEDLFSGRSLSQNEKR
ncbi:hypothetical protein PO124_25315 [Bacillus licheniformis]|nr:hypothetical protein [Bacillus licheniformis]